MRKRKSDFEKLYEIRTQVHDNLEHESDRGLILAISDYQSSLLEALIRQVFVNDGSRSTEIIDSLMSDTGPIGAFSTRIQLAYLMGLLSDETYSSLNLIREIRNCAAHSSLSFSFELPGIREKCNRLADDEDYANRTARRCLESKSWWIAIEIILRTIHRRHAMIGEEYYNPIGEDSNDDGPEDELYAMRHRLFDAVHKESDRGLPLVAASYLSGLLQALLRQVFVHSTKVNTGKVLDGLFRESGDFGSFYVQIQLSYLMGLIGSDTYHALNLIREIRNVAAHGIEPFALESPDICGLCEQLTPWENYQRRAKEGKQTPRGHFEHAFWWVLVEIMLRTEHRRHAFVGKEFSIPMSELRDDEEADTSSSE